MGAAGLLRVEGLRVRLGGRLVLRDVSLVQRRGYHVVLGPSGSGKTTLLRAVAGLVEPEAGRVMVAGRDVTGLPPWERGVALVHQMPGLLPHMSILENVALAAELRGRLPRWEARREAARLLERLGVAGVADRRPVEVSGGQLQRAALAAALAARPRLLLLDEPLSHLDRSTAEAAAELLSRLPREEGVAVLHVTHDLDEALRLAEEITVLHAGRVAETGEAGRVYTCPRSLEAAELLGFNLLHDAAWLGLGGCVAVHPEAVEPLPHPRGGWRLRGMWRERGRVLVELEWRGSSLRLRGYVDPWLAWELRRAGAARLRLRGGVCRLASC